MADSGQHASNAPAMADGSGSAGAGQHGTVGFISLFALVVSAMVGGGIFSLPQNMAQHASAGGQIVAWAITGVGMWFIVNTFRVLTNTKPHMQDGLYAYARTGFGDFVGFLVAYGYWLCNCFSLVAYGVLIMSTLDIFMPGTFTNGNNVAATIGSSLILWLMLAVALLGTKTGALINVAGTVCKIIPVIVFVVALACICKTGVFVRGFWGLSAQGVPLAFNAHRIGAQVSDSMLVTLWLFIGMEGAVVVSGSARHPRDVSRATTAGYLTVLVLYVLVSLLPLGVYSAGQVAQMPNPSMSVIMEQCFGQWGSVMVNVGVIVSVLFAWLVWMIMISQMPLYAAHDGIYPRSFLTTNRFGAPSTGLVWTAITCQLLLILCHFVNGDAWEVMISITSVMAMPCYLLCCVYLWKIAVREPAAFPSAAARRRALATGVLGTLFSLFLVYSAGLRYLTMACALFALGLPLLVVARRQRRARAPWRQLFSHRGWVVLSLIVVLGVCGLVYTVHGGVFGVA